MHFYFIELAYRKILGGNQR